MTDLQTTLTRLKAMRDSGVTSTSVDGVSTTFRSLADLDKRIRQIEQELGHKPVRRGAYTVFMGNR
jgi:hypothetical protein